MQKIRMSPLSIVASLSLVMGLAACNNQGVKANQKKPAAAPVAQPKAAPQTADTPADPAKVAADAEAKKKAELTAPKDKGPAVLGVDDLSPSDIEELEIEDLPGRYTNGCVAVDGRGAIYVVTYSLDKESDGFLREVEKTEFSDADCKPANKTGTTRTKARVEIQVEPLEVNLWKTSSVESGLRTGTDQIKALRAHRAHLTLLELNGKEPVIPQTGFATILPLKVKGERRLLDITVIEQHWKDELKKNPFGLYKSRGWLSFLNAEISALMHGEAPAPEASPVVEPSPSPTAAPSPVASPAALPDLE